MTHKQIEAECLALGLSIRRDPADGRRSFSATADGIRVYWSTSLLGGLLGLPRVLYKGGDTHARSIKEIRYLVKLKAD